MEVGSIEGNRIEYDCAHGTIDEAFVTDAAGHFDLRGTHYRDHGGPARVGEPEDRHPARYTGQIAGATMTLTVALTDTTQTIGTFTLTRGSTGWVYKCL